MPIYLYANPENEKEIVEVIQSVHEEHTYVENGIKWHRVFTVPNASVDTHWDLDDPKSFVDKSRNKKGTVGEIQDKAKELSEERERKHGKDRIKEQFYKDYSNARNGREHPDLKKKRMKKKLKNTHFDWSD